MSTWTEIYSMQYATRPQPYAVVVLRIHETTFRQMLAEADGAVLCLYSGLLIKKIPSTWGQIY